MQGANVLDVSHLGYHVSQVELMQHIEAPPHVHGSEFEEYTRLRIAIVEKKVVRHKMLLEHLCADVIALRLSRQAQLIDTSRFGEFSPYAGGFRRSILLNGTSDLPKVSVWDADQVELLYIATAPG